MSKTYRGRVALVTGGASGIGRALGEELAARGVEHVVLADIDGDGAERAARAIGPVARSAVLDVTDPAAVNALVDAVVAERGRVDIVFNNAGIAIVGDFHAMSLDDFDRLVNVNIRGVMYGTSAALRHMQARGEGHIVNTASVAGLVPSPGFTAYAMTKHAVVGLSKSLRVEAARFGVKVTAACPGFIRTAMVDNAELRGDVDRDSLEREAGVDFYPPRDCARDILDGVAKNRAVVIVTRLAKVADVLHRAAPEASLKLIEKKYLELRHA